MIRSKLCKLPWSKCNNICLGYPLYIMARSRTTNFRGKIHIEIWVDTVCSGNEYELLIGTFCFHVYTYMIDPFSNYESFGTKFN